MSLAYDPLSPPVSVELLDDSPRWSYGTLAANFARVQILVTWYGGDPDRYLDAVARGDEDTADVPFLVAMKHRMKEDPTLIGDVRRILDDFAARFAS